MRIGRKVMVPAVGLALATGGFAFLSNNAFANAPGAGSGTVNVSGYTVSNIHNIGCGTGPDICYTNLDLQAANPAAPDAATVNIEFNGNGNWYSCTANGYSSARVRSFTCDLRANPVNAGVADTMTVSAIG